MRVGNRRLRLQKAVVDPVQVLFNDENSILYYDANARCDSVKFCECLVELRGRSTNYFICNSIFEGTTNNNPQPTLICGYSWLCRDIQKMTVSVIKIKCW
mmetsp:Transcript_24405/g.43719  ORF Transcript_24405/g.43719 Transcript_24405/m.43719 type:complete len:100 (+) Transcript_24405:609-908(+)